NSLIRAEGLWFEDCGLVIRAENTLFRISRDFLALQSPVFRDMLSLPPPKSTDLIDGCPLVVLPDRAEDALIYYDFFVPHPGHASLTVVVSVLRMSDKYQVDALRKRALLHLSSVFPTTLLHYDARKFTQPNLSLKGIKLGESLTISEQSQLLKATCTLTTSIASAILAFLLPSALEAGHDQCLTARIRCRQGAEQRRAHVMPLEFWDERYWNALSDNQEQSTRQAVWDDLPLLEKMKTEALE
ncbi:BTB domain-containing protein, partial [Favolaschia claudopus]